MRLAVIGCLLILLFASAPVAAEPGTTPEKLASRANLLYQKARFLLLDGYQKQALAKLDQAFHLAPDDLRIATLKARVLSGLGRKKLALMFCQGLLSADPAKYGEMYFEMAYVHMALGDTGAALKALEKAEASHPARGLRERGQYLAGLKRFRQAMAVYKKAIALDKDNRAELNLLLARAVYEDQDYDAALAHLQQVARLGPSSFVGKGAETLGKQIELANRPWWVGLSAGAVWDSNVYLDPLVADPAHAVVTGKEDFAWQASFWTGARLLHRGRFSAGLTLYAHRTDYLNTTSGSYSFAAPGLYLGWGRADWGFRASYTYYHYMKTGEQDDYAQMHYLTPTFYWWATPSFVSYFTVNLAERSYFQAGYSGALYGGLSGEHRWYRSEQRKHYLKFTWKLEREDAYDEVSGYNGYEIGLGGGCEITTGLKLDLTFSYIKYDYDRRQEFTLDYAWFTRHDDQYKVALNAYYSFGRWWTVTLSAYYISNDSNVAPTGTNPYDYGKTYLSLTLGKSF